MFPISKRKLCSFEPIGASKASFFKRKLVATSQPLLHYRGFTDLVLRDYLGDHFQEQITGVRRIVDLAVAPLPTFRTDSSG